MPGPLDCWPKVLARYLYHAYFFSALLQRWCEYLNAQSPPPFANND